MLWRRPTHHLSRLLVRAHRLPARRPPPATTLATASSAAGDGSKDTLKLGLDIAQDWRAASSGRSTAWRCRDISRLTYMITVYDTQGETVTDCRTWGADTGIWARIKGAHECDIVLEGSEDTGE